MKQKNNSVRKKIKKARLQRKELLAELGALRILTEKQRKKEDMNKIKKLKKQLLDITQ